MILIIDNYDSFVYNLAQAFMRLGQEVQVHRNDAITLGQVRALQPGHIVLSPGPGHPANRRDFGVCGEILAGVTDTPILGVCLGHQGIIQHFGGKVIRNTPMHGKTSLIEHAADGIFAGLPSPLQVMRYHSLVGVDLPDCLEVTARSLDDKVVMGVRHKKLPIQGVQFHPESIMTNEGQKILKNFLGV